MSWKTSQRSSQEWWQISAKRQKQETQRKNPGADSIKDQHRQLGRQNSRKEKGKAKSPISGAGEMPAEQQVPLPHIPRESLWAQTINNGHPDRETNGANLDPSLTSRQLFQAKSALP